MKPRILFSWVGTADLKAAENRGQFGLGPIGQAVNATNKMPYSEIVLLSDWVGADKDRVVKYTAWLKEQASSAIDLRHVELESAINYGDIYQAAKKILSEKSQKNKYEADFVFHVSPGTPAMGAIWIILSKTSFPAILIESSIKYGVRETVFPFDLSADFIPNLNLKSERVFARLAAGLSTNTSGFNDIIRRSSIMEKTVIKAQLAAPWSVSVLIEGESGTGKELFARAIHDASRKDKPFLPINCGAIPENLLESQLFGYKRGAFTGADKDTNGCFKNAGEGTIFLDEIGELPKQMQVKLLRVLQEKQVYPLGAKTPENINARIIAATNRNLIEDVTNRIFREDLFYRLAGVVIKLPPLREREGDIGLLIDALLKEINEEFKKNNPLYKYKIISSASKNLLINHNWPGNIRELKSTLTRAIIYCDEVIEVDDIREAFLSMPSNSMNTEAILNQPIGQGFNIKKIINSVIKHYIEKALNETHGNKTKAAEALGLRNYQNLNNWLKKLNIMA